MSANDLYLISCEHGGNEIPELYRPLFAGAETLLESHRGHDPGALLLARELARTLDAPLLAATTSRLLVDLNRSPGHPRLFGEPMRGAPRQLRREILAACYQPYRAEAEARLAEAIRRRRRLVHLSSHSFTPALDGETRSADVGLLYDPARAGEAELCRRWQAALKARAPELRVRRNYPYRGTSDGLCAWLRRRAEPGNYVGIELEVNQRYVLEGGAAWPRLRHQLAETLLEALDEHPRPKASLTL